MEKGERLLRELHSGEDFFSEENSLSNVHGKIEQLSNIELSRKYLQNFRYLLGLHVNHSYNLAGRSLKILLNAV